MTRFQHIHPQLSPEAIETYDQPLPPQPTLHPEAIDLLDQPPPPPPTLPPVRRATPTDMYAIRDASDASKSTAPFNNTGDLDKLAATFAEGAAKLGVCKPYPRGQVHTEYSGSYRLIEVPCGCWECAECGPKLKMKWYKRLEEPILHAPYLEAALIPLDEWEAFSRRMRRSGVRSHAKAKHITNDGSIMFLVAAPGEIGGEEVSRFKRKSFLVNMLKDVPFTKQPISTSRDGWIPKVVRVSNENWKTLDSTRPDTLEECEEILDEFKDVGVSTAYCDVSGTDGPLRTLEFYFPPKMMKDKSFYDVLWKLGIHSRLKGERRGERRKKRTPLPSLVPLSE